MRPVDQDEPHAQGCRAVRRCCAQTLPVATGIIRFRNLGSFALEIGGVDAINAARIGPAVSLVAVPVVTGTRQHAGGLPRTRLMRTPQSSPRRRPTCSWLTPPDRSHRSLESLRACCGQRLPAPGGTLARAELGAVGSPAVEVC